MAKATTRYVCQTCGAVTPKWAGRCEACGEWNTIVEEAATPAVAKGRRLAFVDLAGAAAPPPRVASGIAELDRVLGGGFVPGSAVLLAGDPGIGKSTLLLQAAARLARGGKRVLYISGEEEIDNIAMRAARIKGIRKKAPYIDMVTTRVTGIAAGAIRQQAPSLVIVDSIQTIGDEALETHFGGQKQVDNLMTLCIEDSMKVNAATFFVCQRTKAGDPAGPKRAEHLVDVHIKLEKIKEDEASLILFGDEMDDEDDAPQLPRGQYREFHSEKNRFAAAEQRCVLNMTKTGLVRVEI